MSTSRSSLLLCTDTCTRIVTFLRAGEYGITHVAVLRLAWNLCRADAGRPLISVLHSPLVQHERFSVKEADHCSDGWSSSPACKRSVACSYLVLGQKDRGALQRWSFKGAGGNRQLQGGLTATRKLNLKADCNAS